MLAGEPGVFGAGAVTYEAVPAFVADTAMVTRTRGALWRGSHAAGLNIRRYVSFEIHPFTGNREIAQTANETPMKHGLRPQTCGRNTHAVSVFCSES